MIKYFMIGGRSDGEFVERLKGTTKIEMDGDNYDDEEEIYASYILSYKNKGFCAFAVLIGKTFSPVELEILVEKHNLPIYSTEEVTLP